ncbi:MAG: hypothetical protein ABIS47_02395 [Acidimicrobiales bacterium]
MRRSLRLRSATLAALLALLSGGLTAGADPSPRALPAAAKSTVPAFDLAGPAALPVAIRPDGEPGPLAPSVGAGPPTGPAAAPAVAPPAASAAVPTGPVAQAGCPPPPRPPRSARAPGLPKGITLVPEDQVPAPLDPPTARTTDASVLGGRGMWMWQWGRTEGGDLNAVVRRAKAAGLSTLWVRVGDSKSGFYGAGYLDRLVPLAHREGLKVVGWGFPFLGDPVGDAAWTGQVLAWQRDGHRLDAFSPDLETASEGVVVTEKRLATYLGLARQGLAGRPLVATVYNPTDQWWTSYPYARVAAYADVLAPMVYWGCRDPGADVQRAVSRLATFGLPVVPAGQSYNMASDGGRPGNPSGAETLRFLDQARRSGAAGAAFWVWQETSAEQWQAISAYPW